MIDTIFVPRGAEEKAVRKALRLAAMPLRVVTTGIGPLAAARAADEALAGPTMEHALVTGFCGLLSPAFVVGDALIYRELRRDGEAVRLPRALADAVARRVPDAQSGIRALTVENIVTSAHDKLALGRLYGAQAVDMESFAIAERLARAGVAVAVMRVGSDAACDDLPDLHRALDGSGGVDGFALALAMLRRPTAGARLARNGTRALAALRRSMYAVVTAAAPAHVS